MGGLSWSARAYTLAITLAGLLIAVWQLSPAATELAWLWAALSLLAFVTLKVKQEETIIPHQRTISLLMMFLGLILIVVSQLLQVVDGYWHWLGLALIAGATHILKEEGPT
jgi:hypothetical protein